MGILGDIVANRIDKIVNDRRQAKMEEQQVSETQDIEMYNRIWLDKVVHETGYALTDNEQRITNILKKLNERDGHCPCGGMTDEFICPCRMMREYGTCKCGLYRNFVDVNPTGKSEGSIKK